MNDTLLTQLKIAKLSGIKPNFSELARINNMDRRTIKKYYDGYPGKPKHRCKSSYLDKHAETISTKLQIKGATPNEITTISSAPIFPFRFIMPFIVDS